MGNSTELPRPAFAHLFRLGSLVFVVAILFYVLFYSINGARPNSFAFYLLSYLLAGFGVAMASGGVAELAIHRRITFDWRDAGRTSASVIAGLALTLFSARYPPYGVFGMSYSGFPVPFSSTSYTTFPSFTSTNLGAFLVDCIFWIALVYPLVWFVRSVFDGSLGRVGRLESLGVAAFLTYGLYPGWEALFSTGAFNPLFSAAGPVVTQLFLFFLPGLLAGALLAARGYVRLGYTTILASLMLISLLELAILAALLNVVL